MKLKLKPSTKFKNFIIETICLLYVVLFVYAATSKLIDFENFKVQLGQSPLLTAFADYVAIIVPATEFLITAMLVIPRWRFYGLLAAFSLMVMFTTYIIIILNFSDFIPCSCGGILEKLGWKEHLVFNIGFILLALIALLLHRKKLLTSADLPENYYNKKNNNRLIKKRNFAIGTLLTFAGSIVIVVVLYLLSEHEVHRNNGFVRRMPHHPANAVKGIDIKYNSYYLAGVTDGHVYLGNVTAPLRLLSIDTALADTKDISMQIENIKKYSFSSLQVRVKSPNFFISDGRIPIIFRGTIGDWHAQPFMTDKKIYFNNSEPIDGNNFAIRSMNQAEGNILGKLSVSESDSTRFKLATGLLQKKLDGIFDTDGMFSYNEDLQKLVYVYYYRNEYIISNPDFTDIYRGRTIDTLKQADLKIATVKSRNEKKFARNPTKIQQYMTTAGDYLFVKSDRLGKYEPEVMLKDASIVDVYDLNNHTYKFSFYLYNYQKEKVKTFMVYHNLLFGLTDHYLVKYRLVNMYFDFKAPKKIKTN